MQPPPDALSMRLPSSPAAVMTAEATTTAVSVLLAASVATSVAASVAASMASAATGAAAGSAVSAVAGSAAGAASATLVGGAGGASGAAGGVGSATGGLILPVLLGVQRFTASSGLGAPPGLLQLRVAESLRWAEGDIPFLSQSLPPRGQQQRLLRARQRRLRPSTDGGDGHPARNLTADSGAGHPVELIALINLQITCMVGVVFTVAIQWTLVLLWRHCINRRYYRALRQRTRSADVVKSSPAQGARSAGTDPPAAPPPFFPFPKSLLWP